MRGSRRALAGAAALLLAITAFGPLSAQETRPAPPNPGGPQVQPPRPQPPKPQPPKPGRPEIQPPRPGRPEIQPPRPPRPEPPRPPRPEPPRPPRPQPPHPPVGRGSITLYSDVGYGGRYRTFTGSVRELNNSGFADRAASLRVGSGRWMVCEHADYRGRCVVVRGNNRQLVGLGLHRKISSIRYLGR